MIFALANPWRMVAKVYLRILANPCESLRNHELRKHAKGCETLRNHICEFARSLRKHAKSHLRILAKLKYFCECIFAKPCENTCISHLRILAKPCKNTICETLRKVYLLTAPPRLRARHRTRLLSLVLLNVFTLFVVTILKPIVSVSADFLSFVCPNPDMPTNQRRNTVTQLFQEHKIVCNLPDLSCSHKFFRLKSLSRRVRNDRLSAWLIPMSLNVSQDIIVHRKKLNGQQANCPALASEIEPASFAILQQIRNSTGLSAKLTWHLVFLASIQFFVVLDAAVQTQHITNHLVKFQSSWFYRAPYYCEDIFIC